MEKNQSTREHKNKLKQNVKELWNVYRPVLEKKLSYNEAINMSYEELEMFNIALDLYNEKINKDMKK